MISAEMMDEDSVDLDESAGARVPPNSRGGSALSRSDAFPADMRASIDIRKKIQHTALLLHHERKVNIRTVVAFSLMR